MERRPLLFLAQSLQWLFPHKKSPPVKVSHPPDNVQLVHLRQHGGVNRTLRELEAGVVDYRGDYLVVHGKPVSYTVVDEAEDGVGGGGEVEVDGDRGIHRGEGDIVEIGGGGGRVVRVNDI